MTTASENKKSSLENMYEKLGQQTAFIVIFISFHSVKKSNSFVFV